MLNFTFNFDFGGQVARPLEQLFSYLETQPEVSDIDPDCVLMATFGAFNVDLNGPFGVHCFREGISGLWKQGIEHGAGFSQESIAQLFPSCLEVAIGTQPDPDALHAYPFGYCYSLRQGALTEHRGEDSFLVIRKRMLVIQGREEWRGIAGVRPVSGYDWNGGVIGIVILGRHVR